MKFLLPFAILVLAVLGCTTDPAGGRTSQQTPSSPSKEMTDGEKIADVKEFLKQHPRPEPGEAWTIYHSLSLITHDGRAEAQKMLKDLKPKIAPGIRESNRVDYRRIVAEAFPGLNNIGVKVTPAGGGYQLLGYHTLFTDSTFDTGSQQQEIWEWVSDNADELRYAGIVRVGVSSNQGYGSQWLNVPKE